MVKNQEISMISPPDDVTKANILVVDDRRSNLVALEALLVPLGENLVLASSGREALRHILRTDFAVILMDVQMPEMDGLETAALIRQRESSRYIPIIFITAINTEEQYVYQGYSVGAVDYITKPFNPSMLVSKVSVLVELFKKEKQLKEQTQRLHDAELEALRLKQREREQLFEQEKIRAVNRLLEVRVQERTAELEAFCYSVSHDLRSPLRSINGYASALEQDFEAQFSDEPKALLKRIKSSAKKMDELILALLSLSRITRSELHPTAVDITEVSKSIVEELLSNDKGRHVDVQIQDEMVANCDPVLTRSLLFNLIGNAWKFTSARTDATIEVGISTEDVGEVVFHVKDNGIGFNQKYAHKLFQPFERLHATDEYVGNGIGLATVQRIVRKHGGRIWAEGQEHVGAQFFFTL